MANDTVIVLIPFQVSEDDPTVVYLPMEVDRAAYPNSILFENDDEEEECDPVAEMTAFCDALGLN